MQSCTDLCTNEKMTVIISDVYIQLFKRTACFQSSQITFLHTSMWFRKQYKSYSTLLSMLVARHELPNYNNPCARFHHCYRSLFVTQFRQASTIGGRAESVSCLCVCCWLNDGASPILFQRRINNLCHFTDHSWMELSSGTC